MCTSTFGLLVANINFLLIGDSIITDFLFVGVLGLTFICFLGLLFKFSDKPLICLFIEVVGEER